MIHEDFLFGKTMQGAGVFIFPHLHFSIGYKDDRIVSANVSTDPTSRVDISDPSSVNEVGLICFFNIFLFIFMTNWLSPCALVDCILVFCRVDSSA